MCANTPGHPIRSEPIDEISLNQYLVDTFSGVNVLAASGDRFYIYDLDGDLPSDRSFPFATLVTADN